MKLVKLGASSIVEHTKNFIDSLKSLLKVSRPTINQLIPNPPIFLLARPLRFSNGPNDQFSFVVPSGFLTDLASIPPAFWAWQAPHQGSMAPAIIHDFLYWQQPCTREEADAVMFSAMKQVGMSRFDARAIHATLRLAGGSAWDNNEIARKAGEIKFLSIGLTETLIDEDIDPQTTLRDIQERAAKLDEAYAPQFSIAQIKQACSQALKDLDAA